MGPGERNRGPEQVQWRDYGGLFDVHKTKGKLLRPYAKSHFIPGHSIAGQIDSLLFGFRYFLMGKDRCSVFFDGAYATMHFRRIKRWLR